MLPADGYQSSQLLEVHTLSGDLGSQVSTRMRCVRFQDTAYAECSCTGNHRPSVPGVPEIAKDQGMKSRSAQLRFTAVLLFLFLAACANRTEEEIPEPTPSLPDLPVIGGVQDVWNFPFGFGDSRASVRELYGEPVEVAISPVGHGGDETEPTVTIEDWAYEGLTITFYVDPLQEIDYVLSARVTSTGVELRSGLYVGMPEEEATALLGEPAVDTGSSLVYFYLNTTIEIVVPDHRIAEIVLSRAMP
jgi:hypothetical protein